MDDSNRRDSSEADGQSWTSSLTGRSSGRRAYAYGGRRNQKTTSSDPPPTALAHIRRPPVAVVNENSSLKSDDVKRASLAEDTREGLEGLSVSSLNFLDSAKVRQAFLYFARREEKAKKRIQVLEQENEDLVARNLQQRGEIGVLKRQNEEATQFAIQLQQRNSVSEGSQPAGRHPEPSSDDSEDSEEEEDDESVGPTDENSVIQQIAQECAQLDYLNQQQQAEIENLKKLHEMEVVELKRQMEEIKKEKTAEFGSKKQQETVHKEAVKDVDREQVRDPLAYVLERNSKPMVRMSNEDFSRRYHFVPTDSVHSADDVQMVGVLIQAVSEKLWQTQNPEEDIPAQVHSKVGIEKGENNLYLRKEAFDGLEELRTNRIEDCARKIQKLARFFIYFRRYLKSKEREAKRLAEEANRPIWEKMFGGNRKKEEEKKKNQKKKKKKKTTKKPKNKTTSPKK